ncbi:MAG: ABC transporter permease, partial [Acidobacteria bacterium]|nr:ABC transporter permease [Acidobacteriota bacterium]
NPPFWIDIRIDATVLAFVTVTTILAAVVAGIVPALRASRADVMTVMNDEGRGTSSLRMGRFTRGLVVVEMALSFSLLVVSGLVIQSIANTATLDLGFAMRDVWTARVTLPEEDFPDETRKRQAMQDILDRLRLLPGANRVAASTSVPFGGPRTPIKLPDRQYQNDREYHSVHTLTVSSAFFDTLRIPLIEGRAFDDRDAASSLPTAIVNQSFVRTYLPKGALGERLALTSGAHQEWRTIVGVVPDLGIGKAPGDRVSEAIYLPMTQTPVSGITLLIQAVGPPLNLTGPARDAVRAVEPNLPIFNVNTIELAMHAQSWPFRVFGSLFTAFGAAALFLATIGLYGVMAFSVSRRTQEIGVRMAMGAAARSVLGMVLRQGLMQVLSGVLLGIGLAALLGRGLNMLLYGVSPYDPVTFAGIALVLVGTGLIACLIPARRAASVDPMQALRHQ